MRLLWAIVAGVVTVAAIIGAIKGSNEMLRIGLWFLGIAFAVIFFVVLAA